MSILDPWLEEASRLGISLDEPVDKTAMAFVLQKADSLNLLTYKAGMAGDWLIPVRKLDFERRKAVTVAELLAGVAHLATVDNPPSFLKAKHLYTAADNYRRQQRDRALNGRLVPELPPEFSGVQDTKQQIARVNKYYEAWGKAAIATGDYETSIKAARLAVGLPETPQPRKEIAGQNTDLEEVKKIIAGLAGGKKKKGETK